MQRRPGPPGSHLPTNAATPVAAAGTPRFTVAPATSTSRRPGLHKRYKLNNPIVLLIGAALVITSVSWWVFPAAVNNVEQEAESMGHDFVEKARRAEHSLEDLVVHPLAATTASKKNESPQRTIPLDESASDRASAAMKAQSSKWVDGEKKLKKKLMELYEKQQNGELLGVPVLTRWLGDDFPAWVTPDMDEEQWRKDVEAKYKEMREEEEQWKRDMQRIISQRERDLGITTAR